MKGVHRLEQLVEVLEQTEMLLPDDVSGWDDDVRTRLAVERLWITAGNLAEVHRMAAGMDAGVERWAELYRFRNLIAHALPGDLASHRLWAESVADLPSMLDAVRPRPE